MLSCSLSYDDNLNVNNTNKFNKEGTAICEQGGELHLMSIHKAYQKAFETVDFEKNPVCFTTLGEDFQVQNLRENGNTSGTYQTSNDLKFSTVDNIKSRCCNAFRDVNNNLIKSNEMNSRAFHFNHTCEPHKNKNTYDGETIVLLPQDNGVFSEHIFGPGNRTGSGSRTEVNNEAKKWCSLTGKYGMVCHTDDKRNFKCAINDSPPTNASDILSGKTNANTSGDCTFTSERIVNLSADKVKKYSDSFESMGIDSCIVHLHKHDNFDINFPTDANSKYIFEAKSVCNSLKDAIPSSDCSSVDWEVNIGNNKYIKGSGFSPNQSDWGDYEKNKPMNTKVCV